MDRILNGECVLGVVAIGRNEGVRMIQCLQSALSARASVVYVDSGSTDGSVEAARILGVEVVELDVTIPFTAARARNAGFERLLAIRQYLEFVQFVDGDCEIVSGWLEAAKAQMLRSKDVAIVCGRRQERYPNATLYNSLCDMEWNAPLGESQACGGDAFVRVSAFRQVGGYDPTLIAGEEPEMCLRLRRAGWRILRIDAAMTLHDMGMTRFAQWWKRTLRAGHAYAEAAAMHGRSPDRFRVREVNSNWIWGLLIPLAALALAVPTRGISLLIWMLAILELVRRVRRHMIARGFAASAARLYALFVAIGKLPQALGQLRYWLGRSTGQRSKVIDYRGTPT